MYLNVDLDVSKLSVYVKKNSDLTKNGHASPHMHTSQGELVYASAHKLGGGGRGGPAGKLLKIRATTNERKQFKIMLLVRFQKLVNKVFTELPLNKSFNKS